MPFRISTINVIHYRNECIIGDIKLIKNFIDDILIFETNETYGENIKEIENNNYNKI